MAQPNPFRIHGVVEGEFFTDRTAELAHIAATLREPGAKLLVHGPRRMGKTSTLATAIRQIEADGGHAILADLSTASTLADISNRILEAASKSLGRRWRDVAADLVQRVRGSLRITTDAVTGMLVPSFDVSLRQADESTQRTSLASVLDALEGMAQTRATTIGIVLDEFQEIRRFGGDDAEWHLRGIVQHHQHASYVFAGSKSHLIRRMLEQGRAFYGMLDVLAFGPIEPAFFAAWIDARLTGAGLVPDGVGARCIAVAGPRTRDVAQLARKTFDRSSPGDAIGAAEVHAAFVEVVEDTDDSHRAFWAECTPHQQNVLRAVAGSAEGITTAATLERYSLGASGTTSNTLAALVEEGRVVKGEGRSGYALDNPFFRGWIVMHALPDLGIALPPTYRA